MENSLRDAKLTFKDLNEVILVGGSTRIPAVQELVKRITGRDPNVTVNPDEVVALGAAVQVLFFSESFIFIVVTARNIILANLLYRVTSRSLLFLPNCVICRPVCSLVKSVTLFYLMLLPCLLDWRLLVVL